jgi:hypothetical protein
MSVALKALAPQSPDMTYAEGVALTGGLIMQLAALWKIHHDQ